MRLAAFVISLGFCVAPAQQADIETLGRAALTAARSGHYEEAIRDYRRMLALDPKNPSVRYDLALTLYRAGRPRESLTALGVASQADALALAGANYRALGQLSHAASSLRRALALTPQAHIACDLGLTLLDLDKPAEAEQVFRRFPNDPRAIAGQGLAAFARGRNDEAEQLFLKSAALDPGAAEVKASLGDLYAASGRLAEAATAFEQAIRLSPRDASIYFKAGRNAARLDQREKARELLRRALGLNPLHGDAHQELGRLEESLPHLQAAAAIDPDKSSIWYQLSGLYRKKEDAARAADALRLFQETKQDNVGVRVEMSEPVLIVESPAGERRWGRYQFPVVHRLADGRLLAFVHVEADSATAYGLPEQAFVSGDDGLSWRGAAEAAKQPYGLKVGANQWLRTETTPSLDAATLNLPAAAGEFISYKHPYAVYRMSELSRDLRLIFFQRFSAGGWAPESSEITEPDGMRYVTSGRFPRIWWGDMIRMKDGSLIALTYPSIDGREARFRFTAASWKSADQGRTWQFLNRIAYQPDLHADPKGELRDGFAEPAMEMLADGSLYGVLRTTDGNGVGPMYETRSRDQGKIWSVPKVFAPSGVLPRLLRLENGILVLASGRPGVQLRFSIDGTASQWTRPRELLPVTSDDVHADSCGYTSLVALDRDSFLIVYSWFRKPDAKGQLRKAILARRLRVTKTR